MCKSLSRVSRRSASRPRVTCVEVNARAVLRCALLVLLEGSRPISAGGTRYTTFRTVTRMPVIDAHDAAATFQSAGTCFRAVADGADGDLA